MRSASTPLGRWSYDPERGMHALDTCGRREPWRPLFVSLSLTGSCPRRCEFCYLPEARREATSSWTFDDALNFIIDLDRHGVFNVSLGGGEPLLWRDDRTNQTLYDLLDALYPRVRLGLSLTTGGGVRLDSQRLPDISVRLSCHRPEDVSKVLEVAEHLRSCGRRVGANVVLWRSRLQECRDAVFALRAAGLEDILVLPMEGERARAALPTEVMTDQDVWFFLRSLGVDFVQLSACRDPGPLVSSDMGCGAGDWFVAVTETKTVLSCSFAHAGRTLSAPTFAALRDAATDLPRPRCHRSWTLSPIGTPHQRP